MVDGVIYTLAGLLASKPCAGLAPDMRAMAPGDVLDDYHAGRIECLA